MRKEVAEGDTQKYCEDLERRMKQLQNQNDIMQGKLSQYFDVEKARENEVLDLQRQLNVYRADNARLLKQVDEVKDTQEARDQAKLIK